jgi:hypothetical protein
MFIIFVLRLTINEENMKLENRKNRIKIDLQGLIDETQLSYTIFAKNFNVCTETLRQGRETGHISKILAFDLLEKYPKLFEKYRVEA